MRIEVVQRAEDDEEEPPENERDPLPDPAAVGVEGGVDGASSYVLPAARLAMGAGISLQGVREGDPAKLLGRTANENEFLHVISLQMRSLLLKCRCQ